MPRRTWPEASATTLEPEHDRVPGGRVPELIDLPADHDLVVILKRNRLTERPAAEREGRSPRVRAGGIERLVKLARAGESGRRRSAR
jgi:hypothetical protein